jgi:plastocyanin
MKRLLLIMSSAAALSCIAAPASSAAVGTQIVQIRANGFVPRDVVVPQDANVVWVNMDKVDRQIASDTGVFQSPVLKPGQRYEQSFPARGTYSYRGLMKPHAAVVTVRRTASRAVTAAVSKRWVTYGQTIQVTGNVSSGRGGQVVRVFMTPYAGLQQMKRVLTEAGGTWSFRYRPSVRTEIYAEAGGVLSRSAPLVYVRPKLTLAVRNGRLGQFSLRARAGASYAGKLAYLQRRVGSRWRIVRRARVGDNGAVRFRASLPRGTMRLRVTMPPAPGYLRGFSNVVTVNR